MKGTIEFDLPEDESNFLHALQGTNLFYVVYNHVQELKIASESKDPKIAKQAKIWLEMLFQSIRDQNLPTEFFR